MHRAAFAALGLPAHYQYALLDCPDEGAVRAAFEAMRRRELGGVNITAPYKRLAFALADEHDASASAVGVANTIVRSAEGRLVAHNTDVPALADALQDLSVRPRGALVIGAGGAAAAAVAACKQLGFAQIWLTARALTQTSEARVLGGAQVLVWPSHAEAHDALAQLAPSISLIVQATSAGRHAGDGGETIASLVPWASLPSDAVAYDVVYGIRIPPFVSAASRAGLVASDGLGMLARQGARAFSLWHGQEAPLDRMLDAARRHVGRIP